MTKQQLEHILRAAAAITGADELVVIGSQSIHGQVEAAPADVSVSMEADLFSFRSPEDAQLIDGSIGENSPFHSTFGYYAHGVAEETATLPDGWRSRLARLKTLGTGAATGLCLDVNDMAVSKLVAGREKDIEYLTALLRHKLASIDTMRARLAATDVSPEHRRLCELRLNRLPATGV